MLYVIYRVIAAGLCLLTLWGLLREKSLDRVIAMGIISVPFILRAFMIK